MISSCDTCGIRVNNLKIGYATTAPEPAFTREGITFSASGGEMIALIGRNGIGKSTLLHTMAGFLKSLGGEILWNGMTAEKLTPRERSRMISFVSTERIHLTHMQVADLVAYGRFPYTNWFGRMQASDEQAVAEALEKTGLTKYARRQADQLSDGERQRAMIARAVAQDTPFILLDEPTAFLDVNGKYEIFHLLHQLARQSGKTILLSTHDLHIALREMDKFWLLTDNGAFEGAPEDAAMQGWLGLLFNNPLIGFYKPTGDFLFHKNASGNAWVEGDGETAYWTRRALARRGFTISSKEDAAIHILIIGPEEGGNTLWQLTSGGNTRTFASIYDLMKEI